MFYSTSQKVKFAFNTALATLLVAATIFLTTHNFNAAEKFNSFLELKSENFFAMIIDTFIGGGRDNNFFFKNIGLVTAIIAACYVGYLAGMFLDDDTMTAGVILTIVSVAGIIGLFALKAIMQFSRLAADDYEFHATSMIWALEFLETLTIVITAVVSCFRRGLRRYSIFILAYLAGMFSCFIYPLIGLAVCIGICVPVWTCRGEEDCYYGSSGGSYSSSYSGKTSLANSYDLHKEFEEIKRANVSTSSYSDNSSYSDSSSYADDESNEEGGYYSSVTSRRYYDGDGNSLGYSIDDRYYDNDGSCVGYDVGDRHYDSDGNSTGYRVGDREYDSDGNSIGYWVDDTFYEN